MQLTLSVWSPQAYLWLGGCGSTHATTSSRQASWSPSVCQSSFWSTSWHIPPTGCSKKSSPL